jgi:hypothetical protein
MKRIFLFLIMISVSGVCFAKPIDNVDRFQRTIEKCIKGNSPAKCLTGHLQDHVPPRNEAMRQQLPKVAALLVQWLGNDTVYAIHPVKTQKVGDLVDIRYYAIEANAGGFMVMKVKYVKLRGKHYLLAFNLSSTSDAVDALLSGKL